jgi:phosphohistidine phosphatase
MFHTQKKQIILIRHAKAMELSEFDGIDFDRPLSDRGQSSNKIVARYLRLIGVRPDRIVASPAARTKTTADGLAEQYKIDKVEYFDDLYNGDATLERDSDAIHLRIIQKTKPDSRVVMIVGHNNDLTNFAKYLSGESVPSMKKWSIIVLSVPDSLEWKNIAKWNLSFVYYLTPHFLRMEELV